MKTIAELVACAKRELALRQKAYPKWVESGRMKQEQCEHEIECMAEILATLEERQRLMKMYTGT